jgi:DNA-binding CsgD family transcriptional regulator
MEAYVREDWISKNPYLESQERIRRFNEPRFVMDTEVMSIEEMRESQYYRGFMTPYGCYWHAGTSIASPSGDIIKLSIHRRYEDGPLSPSVAVALTGLRPHLARAALIATRLRFEQVKATVEALDQVGLWAAAVKNGRLVVANQGFQALIPQVLYERRERISFVDRAAEKCWTNLYDRRRLKQGGSFPISASGDFPAMVIHVLPITGAAQDIFSAAEMLVVITPSARSANIDEGILVGLFDLTHAEAAVAGEIARGRSVESIASARNVSVGTIRVQLHSVFQKTGTKRQQELAHLLSGLAINR